jgi:mono/diheme cytochrome c family protein
MRFRCLAAGVVILAGVGMWQAGAGQESGAKKASGQDAADLIEHGDYLVNAAAMCGDCHTPRDDQGKPNRTRQLRGAPLPIRPKKEAQDWAEEAPDITGTGLAGQWSEQEMVKFLTTGTDPDGMEAMPPMPAFRLNARDARAVYLYLKSLPAQEAGGKREQGKNPE